MEKTMTYNELMENEAVTKGAADVIAAIEKDAEAMKLIDAADTVEGLYEATKRFLQITWEDFKKVFISTMDYLMPQKTALQDEVLDNVVGGWSISGFFSSLSQKAKCVARIVLGASLAVACGALAVTAVVFGGPVGAVVGGVAGTVGFAYGVSKVIEGAADLSKS